MQIIFMYVYQIILGKEPRLMFIKYNE
jgi:hypothetical protein